MDIMKYLYMKFVLFICNFDSHIEDVKAILLWETKIL